MAPSNGSAVSKAPTTGAHIIAQTLHSLGIKVIFGIVGIPVVEIAEEAINLGIRFIGFRNEQAASYAASAYGFLTGRPGVCLVVGGPGVLHAMAGIGNSHANAFPLLLLAGSSETHLVTRGAFQELDAITLLAPHTKVSIRPPALDLISPSIESAYRTSFYSRPGTSFIDLPADLIQGKLSSSTSQSLQQPSPIPTPPKPAADPSKISQIATLLRSAKAPLIVIGKGAAYARAESIIRSLVSNTNIHFLPTPMGKGVLPDSHPRNTASARSTALKEADVVLVLGARLNWILHFGEPPKWSSNVKIIQIDIDGHEIGRNAGSAELGVVGDISIVCQQLLRELDGFTYDIGGKSDFSRKLAASTKKNEAGAAKKVTDSAQKLPMSFARAFDVIKNTLHSLSPPEEGNVVYVSEGANTMDISRSVFPVEFPRLRLDAGTYATMGVGMGYAIAAWEAYNGSGKGESGGGRHGEEKTRLGRKKIVCLEGDSAFGFSGLEIETMARYGMDVLIFVMNNSGVYHGDADDKAAWEQMRQKTVGQGSLPLSSAPGPKEDGGKHQGKGLRSTSLGWEVGYEKIAEGCGGIGHLVRTPEELEDATKEGWRCGTVCVVNVVIESGKESKLGFAWQQSGAKKGEAKL